ncbi:MAG: hypothetical protein BWK79_06625 [Beggiatoa sp. IS2]|nr:MAG: hypothetical protein BWK79_06625 [Beggiatoa sp. IS2]
MPKFLTRLWVLSLTLLIPVTPYAADPNEPIAMVNGKPLTQQHYDNYVKARSEQVQANASPTPEVILNELISRELVIQDAINNKLDKDPLFLQKMQEIRENLLAAMGMRDYSLKHTLEDATLKSEYNKMESPKEYKVKHILVATEESAKAASAELAAGKAFAEIARDKSIDPVSAKNDGDLGWVTQNQVVAEFGKALETLAIGKPSAPVKSQFGWHLIQVDEVRNIPLPPFESVKDKIRETLHTYQMQNYVNELKKNAKVEILKKFDTASTVTPPLMAQPPASATPQSATTEPTRPAPVKSGP